jgi:alkanesulfonate monooxygenase SsuD/methylene tetrahydromethanopterin reductase-like flavin-dependent oxidoreductase (luciferase family)
MRIGQLARSRASPFSHALLAATKRWKLIVAILPGPWNPALAAKQLATLDQLTGGRVAVNIVSGWFRGEFHAIGEPYRSSYNLTLLIRSALPITDTELNDIAAPAMTGLSKTPNNG